jgi:CRISPR-associated endonuclease Cas1
VNSLLSFGFSGILEPLVRRNILSVGLLPEVGFLHETRNGREPLVWDLEESFRRLIMEATLKTLPQITRKAFLRNGDYLLRMKPETIKLFVANIREIFEEKIPYKGEMWKTESIILDYVRILAKSLQESKIPYFPTFG